MSRRHPGCALAAAALLLAAACTPGAKPPSPSAPSSAPTASPSAAASASTGPTAATLKPPLAGLVDRQGVPAAKNPSAGAIGGVVINLDWAQVEPTRGAIDFGLLDSQLAAVDAFGAGRPVRARLRIVGGLKAPDWLKDAAGRVHVDHHDESGQGADDFSGDLPRFWTDVYGAAYDDLQRRLAERYDGDPRLADVVIGRCVTVWAEPFVRQSDDGVRLPLLAAGYTVAADQACEAAQIASHDAWRGTRSTLSLNPFMGLTADRRAATDIGFTLRMIDECRARLGERCVLANNSIRTPLQTGDYDRLYAAIIAKGDPITFQTAKKERIGDLPGTLDWAAGTAHACSVELPQGYDSPAFAPPGRLADAAARLGANCPG